MLTIRQKIIVYVTKQTLMASLWYGEQYQSHQIFENQLAGHIAFRQYLLRHKQVIIYLVIDAVEEEYQLEALPKVPASARREMLARKLAQFSRNSVYKTAWFMRQETTTRKDSLFVLLSLTNTQFLQEWVEILQSTQALLAGVLTLPMLSQIMVRQMKITTPALLICERLSSGFRQTYLQDDRLRISRLTPIEHRQNTHLTDFYVAEIEKMRVYLLSQRIASNATIVQILLFSDQVESHAIAAMLAQQGVECSIANRHGDMDSHHLQPDDLVMYPELHYLQRLKVNDLPVNFAPVAITKAYRLRQLRRKLDVFAALLMLIGLCIALYFLVLGLMENEQIAAFKKQTDALLEQQALIVKRHPDAIMSAAELKSVVTVAEMVSQQSPIMLMQIISAALADMPEVSISRIRWLQSDARNIADDDGGVFEKQANIENKSSQALLPIGFLSGYINPPINDYQQALDSLNRLLTQLRADKRVRTVVMVQTPTGAKLTEGSTSHELIVEPALLTFTLKIALHPMIGGERD